MTPAAPDASSLPEPYARYARFRLGILDGVVVLGVLAAAMKLGLMVGHARGVIGALSLFAFSGAVHGTFLRWATGARPLAYYGGALIGSIWAVGMVVVAGFQLRGAPGVMVMATCAVVSGIALRARTVLTLGESMTVGLLVPSLGYVIGVGLVVVF